MILVLWEESFKSLEADYSNHLASPLAASCGEISPSPRIHCDKFKSPTRDAVLGHLETGHPNNRTQCGVIHPLKPCLIGRCKDMMSSMDPMRALGMQEEAAETSLVTRKFSSSIFCWKELRKIQEGENKNTKEKPWSLHFGASGKSLSPAFYSHKEAC